MRLKRRKGAYFVRPKPSKLIWSSQDPLVLVQFRIAVGMPPPESKSGTVQFSPIQALRRRVAANGSRCFWKFLLAERAWRGGGGVLIMFRHSQQPNNYWSLSLEKTQEVKEKAFEEEKGDILWKFSLILALQEDYENKDETWGWTTKRGCLLSV